MFLLCFVDFGFNFGFISFLLYFHVFFTDFDFALKKNIYIFHRCFIFVVNYLIDWLFWLCDDLLG